MPTANDTTRRAFLTGGAMLAASALLLPSSAAAIAPTQPATDTDVLARVRAALTTPRTTESQCPCLACRAAMAQPFRCSDCGYSGRPATAACGCARAAAFQLEHYSDLLRKYPNAASWPKDWATPRRDVRQKRRRLQQILAERPVGLCLGHGAGQPADLNAVCGFEGDCVHTCPRCPICDGFGDYANDDEMRGILAVLRDVNAVLFPMPA